MHLPIDRQRIYEVPYQLEGEVLRLSDGRCIAIRTALRKRLGSNLIEIKIPEEIIIEVEKIMHLMLGYRS